ERQPLQSPCNPPSTNASKCPPLVEPVASTDRSHSRQFARGLAPAVNKKEKSSHSNKQQCAAKHPYFIRKDRSNLLRREKSQRDAEGGCQQSTPAGEKQR